ncbi:MAG: Ig-like domain-containing protein [Candidatus Aminicenantales bacterium]
MKNTLGLFLIALILLISPVSVLGDEVVYSQGFESDNGSYAAAGTAQWAWGTPTVVGPASAHSGLYCWGTNLSGNIPALANGNLTSPAIPIRSVAANESVRASFWLYSYLSTMQDRGEFQTSSDGANWTSVLKFYEQMSGGWQRYEFDVTSYAGGNLHVRFVANKAYTGGGATPGLYVDDVAITIRTKPATATTFTLVGYEDPSSFSSCPWVHAWDGTQFARDNDIYSVGRQPAGEYTDYYLMQKPLAARDGRYDLEIREIESEDSWTDMAGLLAIDHGPGIGIGPDQAGRIHAYDKAALTTPSSAVDGKGKSVLSAVMTRDDSGYPGYDGDAVEMAFAGADLTAGAHLLVRIKGFIMGEGEPRPYSGPPAVIVEAAAPGGSWREAGRLLPRFEWSEGVFDLAPFLSERTDGIKVRLKSVSHASKYHEIDYVALAPGAEPVFRSVRQPLSSASAKGADVRSTLDAADGKRVEMHPDDWIAVSFSETARTLPEREFIFISRGYYIPRGGTFLIYTWDGSNWIQRDARSTTGSSDTTMNFDLGLFLPDPAGDFKVRVWQDYKYEGARIDFAGLVTASTTGTLSYAHDLRGGGSGTDILGLTQAIDGSRLTYGSGNRDRWSEYRWSGLTTVLPPTTNPVAVSYPTISWTYADPQSLEQSNYYVEVWTGAGGSGTIMWNPAMGSGTGTSVTYAGTTLTPSATYYARVRAYNGSVWGGWSERSFTAPSASTYSVSASAGANGALDTSTTSPVSVALGGTASFKFNAAAGYHIASISGCGGTEYTNTSNTVNSYTFTTGPIAGDCAVAATFAINTYTISGTVRTAAGAGLENVALAFSGTGSSASSGADGRYSRVVTHGWTGTITPSLAGYSFDPVSRSCSSVAGTLGDQDFTVTQGAPSIVILTPAGGDRLAGTVEVLAKAEDRDGISKTEIHIDGTLMTSAAEATCFFSWNTAGAAYGEHVIKAVAFDTAGLKSEVEIKVIVDNPPSVKILSPRDASTIYGPVTVKASASDDQSVSRVEFFVDGGTIGKGMPAAAGNRESGLRKAVRTERNGIREAAAIPDEAAGAEAAAAATEAGNDRLVYIDRLGGLRKLGATGAPERVLERDPRALYVRPGAGNVLFVVFDEPQAAGDGRSCRLGAVDLQGGWIAGVETGELRIRTDFRTNPAIQFDSLGNVYYVVRTADGMESLRAWDGGNEAMTLFDHPARMTGWLVGPDGTALVYGKEAGAGWLYRIDRSGNRIRISGAGIEALWAVGSVDGGAYIRLADSSGTAVSGIYRLEAKESLLAESRARAPLVGRTDHRFSPRLDTAGFPEPARAAWDGMGLAGWTVSTGGRLFALLKGTQGESLVLELAREPRTIDIRNLDEITLIRAVGNQLLASGTAAGTNRLVSVDLGTRSESVLIGDELRIDRMEILADGRPVFQAFSRKAGQVLIGTLNAIPDGDGFPGFEILTVLGTGEPLGFEALNGAGNAASTDSAEAAEKASASSRSLPLAGPEKRGSGGKDSGTASRRTNYTIVWDTSSLANGAHEVKAVATDPAGQTTSDAVTVNVQNLSLTLNAFRRQASAWLITREYGEIRIGAQNPGAVPIVKYVLYRRSGTASARALKEYASSQLDSSGLVYFDKYLGKGVRYSYQVVAYLEDGSIAGASTEKTI